MYIGAFDLKISSIANGCCSGRRTANMISLHNTKGLQNLLENLSNLLPADFNYTSIFLQVFFPKSMIGYTLVVFCQFTNSFRVFYFLFMIKERRANIIQIRLKIWPISIIASRSKCTVMVKQLCCGNTAISFVYVYLQI